MDHDKSMLARTDIMLSSRSEGTSKSSMLIEKGASKLPGAPACVVARPRLPLTGDVMADTFGAGGFMRRVTWGPDRQRVPQTGRVWLGSIAQRLPIVPVKIELDSSWGRTIAYLRRLEP